MEKDITCYAKLHGTNCDEVERKQKQLYRDQQKRDKIMGSRCLSSNARLVTTPKPPQTPIPANLRNKVNKNEKYLDIQSHGHSQSKGKPKRNQNHKSRQDKLKNIKKVAYSFLLKSKIYGNPAGTECCFNVKITLF